MAGGEVSDDEEEEVLTPAIGSLGVEPKRTEPNTEAKDAVVEPKQTELDAGAKDVAVEFGEKAASHEDITSD